MGFFSQHRGMLPVYKKDLVQISTEYEHWTQAYAQRSGFPVVEDLEKRRDKFMEPYFVCAQPDQIVGVIKAREPVRILTAVGRI